MLTKLHNRNVFIAGEPIDFRMSIDSLSRLVEKNGHTHLHDGSIYVFYNKHKNRIKCLFWDKNGLALYYKRLENTTFKFKLLSGDINGITYEQLESILSGEQISLSRKNLKYIEN